VSDVDDAVTARLDHIERQLRALFPNNYVPFAAAHTGGMPAAVLEHARAGNMIAAIKEYRRITGAGLAEAKQAVEAIG
jgi:ribosomal protein L7/L12